MLGGKKMDWATKKLLENIELYQKDKDAVQVKIDELESKKIDLDESIHNCYRNLYIMLFDATYEEVENLELFDDIDYVIYLCHDELENLKC
jgi:hypothetical protein